MQQISLALVEQEYHGMPVLFQPDGFINATQVAKHFGKRVGKFLETEAAKRKIIQVSEKRTLDVKQIVITTYGKPENGGGTWLHPKLAVPFAMWCDDDFAWWAEEQIEKLLRGEIPGQKKSIQAEYAELFLELASINRPYPGYYSILESSAQMMLACVGAGLPFNQHSIALISIGRAFKNHWDKNNLNNFYPSPVKYRQIYPSSFPQSTSGYMDVWHYPLASMEAFENWMRTEYLPNKYPAYLQTKVKQGAITAEIKVQLISAVNDRFLLAASSVA